MQYFSNTSTSITLTVTFNLVTKQLNVLVPRTFSNNIFYNREYLNNLAGGGGSVGSDVKSRGRK